MKCFYFGLFCCGSLGAHNMRLFFDVVTVSLFTGVIERQAQTVLFIGKFSLQTYLLHIQSRFHTVAYMMTIVNVDSQS